MKKLMKLSNLFSVVVAILMVALMGGAMAPKASAGFEGIEQTITVDAASTNTTVTIPMERSAIKDVILWVPTLDATDTATASLRVSWNDSTYTPTGWSDKGIAADEDNAIVKCNASQMNIIVDGAITFTCETSTTQTAQRVFKVLLLREY